jgi:hypothetical protein
MEDNLTFSAALVRLKKDDQIARSDWEEGHYLELSKDSKTIFEMSEGDDWVFHPMSEDLLADDWRVVKESE